MKRSELITSSLLLPLDFLMLFAAGWTAYALRFHTSLTALQPVVYQLSPRTYAGIVALTAAVWVIIFSLVGLYRISGTRRIVEEVRSIFYACSIGVLAIIVLFFFQRDLFSSRFIILSAYGLAILYVSIARIIVIYIERYLFIKGIGVHRIAFIGAGHVADIIKNEMDSKPMLGFRVVAQYADFGKETQQGIVALHEQDAIDQLVLTDPRMSQEESEQIFDFCVERHLGFKYVAAIFDTPFTNIDIRPIGGIPIVEVKKTRLDGWGRIVKRLFDIIGALFFIVLTGPVMIAAAIAIVIDSGFPIFFSKRDDDSPAERVGQYGKPFKYFKFRSMKVGMDQMRYSDELSKQNVRTGPLVKIENDPRITRVGRFIRKFSIDELPEFFLVLKGDMSLVGPRPHRPEEVAQYKPHHKHVLNMKPGVTGMAQVSGRSDLDFEDEVRLDTFYMENWSLLMDLIIILKTPLILLKKRSAL